MKTDSLYRVPDTTASDIEEHTKALDDFRSGRMDPLKFKILRVTRGIYEQRIKGKFMVRIRIPGGGVTSKQMNKIAHLSRTYGDQVVHVTNRQDVQLHSIDLDQTPLILRELLEVGLTTKGGGGNTVRNITACCAAGICSEEVFDVTPYAIGMTEFMIKDPASFTLPRKYKIAFSGCGKDCAFATVNDMGFIAKKEKRGSEEIRGFRAYVAGGMGAYSRVGEFFDEFVPAEAIGYMAEAIKRLFDKHGNRRNKHKARLRFVMDRYGPEKFKELYLEELQKLKNEIKIDLDIRPLPDKAYGDPPTTMDGNDDFLQWKNKHTQPQKDEQFSVVELGFPMGLISADQLEKLGELADRFSDGSLRTTQNQNLSMRWVKDLGSLYTKLKSSGFNLDFGESVSDVICCPGSSTCQLGICLARGLGKQVTKSLESVDPKGDIRDIRIRISGCPNSCGQHPIGPIGIHGAARRVGEHMAPFYKILLGGRTEEGKTAIGEEMGIVPAKNVPALLTEFVSQYHGDRLSGEDFYGYLERCGKTKMRDLVQIHAPIPSYEENRDYYVDWDATEDFTLAGRGAGECGAGVFDMIESDLNGAKKAIAEAATFDEASIDFFESIHNGAALAARTMLVTQGVDANNEREIFNFFEDKFINQGLADKKFLDLFALTPKRIRDEGKNHFLALAQELCDTIQNLYDSMDDSLRFKIKTDTTQATDAPPETAPAQQASSPERKLLDLRGTPCPFNYVKVKLFLEQSDMGDIVEILLDDGSPIKNVPQSLKNDGQKLMDMTKQNGGHYKIVVEKTVELVD